MHDQAQRPPRRRKKYILLLVLSFLLIIAAAALWYWETHKKGIIKDKIETAITEKTDGAYAIKYDNLELDEIAGWLMVSNLTLKYDSLKLVKDKEEGTLPSIIMDITVPLINVTGIKTPKALVDNEIIGEKVVVMNPVINLHYTRSGKDSSRNIPTNEIYKQILGGLDIIKLDTVVIKGAQVTTFRQGSDKKIIALKDVTITLTDLLVDSTSFQDTSRFMFAKGVDIDAAKVEWASADNMYNYSASRIAIGANSTRIDIGNFKIIPALGEEAFTAKLKTQDDRFDFDFNNINIEGVSFHDLSNEFLVAHSMTVSQSKLLIYRDLSVIRDTENRVGTYPQQVIDDIPFKFIIGSLNIRDSYVEYKERSAVTKEAGRVQFHNISATIVNFTNHPKSIAKNNIMRADVKSSFMNVTPLNTTWTFYLLHPKGRFDLKGSLGPVDGPKMNPLTEPMGPATIKEGKVDGITFNFEGHDYGATGTVTMLYKNLKVHLLELDKGASKTDKKFLMSLLANLVIKNSNPSGNDAPRVAQVDNPRDINHSIFHLCWKSLFKGIRESIGVKK